MSYYHLSSSSNLFQSCSRKSQLINHSKLRNRKSNPLPKSWEKQRQPRCSQLCQNRFKKSLFILSLTWILTRRTSIKSMKSICHYCKTMQLPKSQKFWNMNLTSHRKPKANTLMKMLKMRFTTNSTKKRKPQESNKWSPNSTINLMSYMSNLCAKLWPGLPARLWWRMKSSIESQSGGLNPSTRKTSSKHHQKRSRIKIN